MKKILLFLVLIILLAGAGWFYFFKIRNNLPKSGAPVVSIQKGIKALISEPAISPVLSLDGAKIWYLSKEGKLFRVYIGPEKAKPGSEPEGSTTREEFQLPQVSSSTSAIIWPKGGNDFILEINEAGHLRYRFYDSAGKKFIDYPAGLRAPRFLEDSQTIVYDWTNAKGMHELKTSAANNSNFQKIADLFKPDNEIVPSPAISEVVLFSLLATSKLYLVDLASGKFTALDSETKYTGASFSPDGKKLLASRNGNLVIYDLETLESKSLDIEAQAGQTTWSKDGTKLLIGSDTGFVKYDFSSSQSEQIYTFKTEESYDPVDLIWLEDKSQVIFRDAKTGYLYKLNL